ncbi:hypothetical protein F4778DRAFT_353408 [Xylariomycetidae sp. FL2044]|nr:hypothetical protein F4778DRAFT_353408 [Xylariomycetidae sp. FL2044]
MYWFRIAWPAAAALFTSPAYGQQSGWQEGQQNATMCMWQAPRAAVLKDTVYIDGGYLYWVPGMTDGSYGAPTQDNNPLGYMYTLNFSTPFNSSTNVSDILTPFSKSNGGAANNLAPNYYDGALLANNDELYLYGGLLSQVGGSDAPDGDDVLKYEASWYGADGASFHPGFRKVTLPDGLTRYVTYGGAVNAPSENKAWYFGGYRSPSWGPIYYPTQNASLNPTNVSDSFIQLDMAEQLAEKWSNKTLPSEIPSRANPSVVWVPVGEQGILVVLGGVSFPNYNNPTFKSQNEAQSEKDGPTYMSNVGIYDIANDIWYQQPTVAAPSQLALGCAVVAPAQDFSSYNIYYYGGYNGIDSNSDFNDDVWILSLPSFMWMKVSSGSPEHARAGHQCVTPYPDQMVVIGGYTSQKGGSIKCLDGGVLQVFNLTEGHWMDSYDPDSWNNYGVPEMIHLMIGGDFTGGATMTTPTPTGWATSELANVFATTYATSKLTTFYPYSSSGPGGTRGQYKSGGGGMPSWVAPVLGVVLGLVFVTAVVVGILLYRRRRLLRRNGGTSESRTEGERDHRVLSWVRGQTGDKAGTVTTDDTPTNFDDMESRGVTPMRPIHSPEMAQNQAHEMAAHEPLVELMDTSPRVELPDTPHLGSGPHSQRSLTNPPFYAGGIGAIGEAGSPRNPSISSQQISTPLPSPPLPSPPLPSPPLSQQQQQHQQQPQPPPSPHSYSSQTAFQPPPPPPSHQAAAYQRPDSPSLGTSPSNPTPSHHPPQPQSIISPPRNAVVSDLSRISDREAAHLRNISDATVSSATGTVPGTPPPHAGGFTGYHNPHSHPLAQSPMQQPGASSGGYGTPMISPPSADGREATDYVSVHSGSGRSLTSPIGGGGGSGRGSLRRSVFLESRDDLGEDGGSSQGQGQGQGHPRR